MSVILTGDKVIWVWFIEKREYYSRSSIMKFIDVTQNSQTHLLLHARKLNLQWAVVHFHLILKFILPDIGKRSFQINCLMHLLKTVDVAFSFLHFKCVLIALHFTEWTKETG